MPQRTSFLRALAAIVIRRAHVVLMLCLLALVLAIFGSRGLADRLALARWEVPGSESSRASAIVHERFASGSPNVVVMVSAKTGTVDDEDITTAGLEIGRELGADPSVAEVSSYWSRGRTPTLRSDDRKHALVVARMLGTTTEVRKRLTELSPRLTREDAHVLVRVGGREEVFRQVGAQSREDMQRAELFILPAVLVLLLVVFRGPIAAVLPLLVGAFAVMLTLGALRVLTAFTDVSVFALNLTTVMGLGLGIDYSLFIVSRFREEMSAGHDVGAAILRTVETAGRTVAFSAATVAASLAGLFAFPFFFLRSFAYAGITVVVAGSLGALVMLPAILTVIGRHIDRGAFWTRNHTGEVREQGFWHRLAVSMMQRPLLFGGAAVALLLALGSPFLGLRLGSPDDRVLPATASSRQVQQTIRDRFSAEETDAIQVILSAREGAVRDTDVEAAAVQLSRVRGVAQVDSRVGSFAGGQKTAPPDASSRRFSGHADTWLSVVPAEDRILSDEVGLVRDVRAAAPRGALVGGDPAELVDFRAELLGRVPLVGTLILGASFVVLFLMSGSVLLPLKATALNILSLSATFGALVWIYQEGHLSDLLGFTATGTLEPSIPILVFAISFGLSMDYEVFVLSRIKEEHDRTGDNVTSVAIGIERSAPLVTAAAALLAVTFGAFASSRVVLLQMLGVGVTLAVIVDATVIRVVLVPALMRLAGEANWWAPPFLRRVHARFGFRERDDVAGSAPSEPSNGSRLA
ncbi:MAG: drug exporter of the superfamily-like protein [Labilithrix sp.]|nr:drug exporter of the superfamily-like protein [Labilithrix sp.]